jgi:hypothetical protein
MLKEGKSVIEKLVWKEERGIVSGVEGAGVHRNVTPCRLVYDSPRSLFVEGLILNKQKLRFTATSGSY